MYKHALIAMKAYPFHHGHAMLIARALNEATFVTVMLVYDNAQEPNGEIRASWIQKMFPNVHLRLVHDLFTDDTDPKSSELWARYTKQLFTTFPFDVVYSSENYGVWWAAAMGIAHEMVDKERIQINISGTKIRSNPIKYFDYLAPSAKPYYTAKILVVGAESTGKSTLCLNLARHYNTLSVPEYGRIYCENVSTNRGDMNPMDEQLIFPQILTTQPAMERQAQEYANRFVFCDTDLFVTSLWYERWQKIKDRMYWAIWNRAVELLPTYALVFVMDPDTPFVDDGYREFNVQAEREEFTERLKINYPSYTLLTGTWDERQQQAVAAIEEKFDLV